MKDKKRKEEKCDCICHLEGVCKHPNCACILCYKNHIKLSNPAQKPYRKLTESQANKMAEGFYKEIKILQEGQKIPCNQCGCHILGIIKKGYHCFFCQHNPAPDKEAWKDKFITEWREVYLEHKGIIHWEAWGNELLDFTLDFTSKLLSQQKKEVVEEFLKIIGKDEEMIAPTNLEQAELLERECINAITSHKNLLRQHQRAILQNKIEEAKI